LNLRSLSDTSFGTYTYTCTVPYAFFPHKYNPDAIDKDVDGVVNATESATNSFIDSYTVASTNGEHTFPAKPIDFIQRGKDDLFQLFFDERLTRNQAFKMITAAEDGKFLDEQTQSLAVQFVTYNVPHDIFCLSTVSFDWLVGGKIEWKNDHGSISSSPAPPITLLFFGMVVVCLIANSALEGSEILEAFRRFEFLSYASDAFDMIDLTHLLLMWYMVTPLLFSNREFPP